MILNSYLQGLTLSKTVLSKTCNFSTVYTVKSDRINALRQKYDAFLEEDKRRKERNEYILGRLDKMRYCTAVVPLRHNPTLFIDRRDNLSTSSSLSQLNKSSLDIPRQVDEATVLQEISKKYILIPKITSNNETENISHPTLKPAADENGDWKSKYEILDQLKKREKESDASAFGAQLSQCNPNYDKKYEPEANALTFDTELSQQHNYEGLQNRDVKKYGIKGCKDKVEQSYKYDIPKSDKEEKNSKKYNPFEKKMEYEYYPFKELPVIQNMNEEPPIKASTNNLPQNIVEFNSNSKQLEINACIENEPESTPTFYSESPSENENANIQDYPIHKHNVKVDPTMYSKQNLPVEEDKDVADTEKVYPEDIQPVEVLRPDELIKQINITPSKATLENVEQTEQEQVPIEPIIVEDLSPGNDVILQDGVNINPEGYAIETDTSTYNYNNSSEIAENIEDPVDTSGIEEFEAEQREMFYPEGINESYENNQDNVAEVYNQEPVQGGDYTQGEEKAYYEGYEAEQAYPIETCEQEDVTQRYDPHYELQYATDYAQPEYRQEGYEQQVFSQDPHYEGDTNQIQEGLEHLQLEQHHQYETVENIQQQLDTEQGYTEQINMSVEKPTADLQKQPIDHLQNQKPQSEKQTA